MIISILVTFHSAEKQVCLVARCSVGGSSDSSSGNIIGSGGNRGGGVGGSCDYIAPLLKIKRKKLRMTKNLMNLTLKVRKGCSSYVCVEGVVHTCRQMTTPFYPTTFE